MERMAKWLDQVYLIIDRRMKGWPTLFLRTTLAFDQDNGAVMSRSIAYYALFSIFPLLLVLMSVFSSVLDLDQATQVVLDLVDRYLPHSVELVEQNLSPVFEAQSTIGILALLGLAWSASGVFTAMYRSVNRAWNNPKAQLFWTEKLYGLAVVIVVGLALLATTLYSTIAQSRLLDHRESSYGAGFRCWSRLWSVPLRSSFCTEPYPETGLPGETCGSVG
jgi:membrane protein